MKSRYALPVFLLSIAIFWLSLLLTFNLRRTPESYEGFPVSYTELEGIDSLELINSDENAPHYSSTMYIRYADQPHITVKVRNLAKPESAIQRIFVRKGSRLTLQADIHQAADEKAARNNRILDDTHWRISEIILPAQIHRLITRGIELDIASSDDRHSMKLPELHIDTEDASIDLDKMRIASLSIRNRYNKPDCEDKRTHTYSSAQIKIKEKTEVDALLVESVYGHIELKNSARIKAMRLKTTPETSIELDRLDIYPRMRWEPLPPPELPACKNTQATQTSTPPSIKAQ